MTETSARPLHSQTGIGRYNRSQHQPLPTMKSLPNQVPSGPTLGDQGSKTTAQADPAARAEAELDHALVRRAQEGDEQAFADLVGRHQGRAWRVARGMVPSEEDAQDLAQEAFLRVFKNLERFDFKHDFTTWLYRIVTNLAIDLLRKRRPVSSLQGGLDEDQPDYEPVDPSGERPSDAMEAEETAGEVHEVLSTLAPHFQSALVLRELEGLSCADIADIVGATNVTVRWRLHRGRKLFQEEWERRSRTVGPEEDGPLS